MAKNNNLTDYLTDLANAIREKKGTTDPINPQDFSAEIASIETGGGGGGGEAVAENDVNFRDYDGTIVHSYTKAQFLALSELPELPTHEGLVAQGWNWTLAAAQSYVADMGIMEIGANYNTNDNKTRLYFSIPYDNYSITLRYNQSDSNGVRVLWGDGTTEQYVSSTGNQSLTHTYAKKGDYVCVIRVYSGEITLGGSYGLLNASSWQNDLKGCFALKKAEVSSKVTGIGSYMFGYCINLESVSLPTSITTFGRYSFAYCTKLRHITIPPSVTTIDNQCFNNCYNLEEMSLPKAVPASQAFPTGSAKLKRIICPAELIASAAYLYCYSLIEEVTIPNGATSLAKNMFANSYVRRVILPDSIESIGTDVFNQSYYIDNLDLPDSVKSLGGYSLYRMNLSKFIAPANLETIGSTVFYDMLSLAVADFRKVTKVPTLGTSNFNKGNPKIVVPDNLYDEWIAATNWSSLASKIVKASSYTD